MPLPHCRRSRLSWFATVQQQTTDTRLKAQNVSFQKLLRFSIFSGSGWGPDGVFEMLVFNRLGGRTGSGRGPDGVFEMLVFNRLGGQTGSGWGPDGVFEMLVFNRDRCNWRRDDRHSLQLHTAATGFAGICTDATLPLCLAASVLSRVFEEATTARKTETYRDSSYYRL